MSDFDKVVRKGCTDGTRRAVEIELDRKAAVTLNASATAMSCSKTQYLRYLVTKAMAQHQQNIAH